MKTYNIAKSSSGYTSSFSPNHKCEHCESSIEFIDIKFHKGSSCYLDANCYRCLEKTSFYFMTSDQSRMYKPTDLIQIRI